MTIQTPKFEHLFTLMEQHSVEEGITFSAVEGFGTYKASQTSDRKPALDQPALWIIGQGKKVCHVGERQYDFTAGNVVVLFYPMAVEAEVVEASPEKPLILAGVLIDMARMADVLLRVDKVAGAGPKPVTANSSGIFSIPLDDNLMDPIIRLFETVADPVDAAVLGDSIIDEIYYRLLMDERGGELRYLLQQRGEIQRISKAVEYIHSNVDKPVSVEKLADMVYMSRTSFYENFKNVMHLSPLQYAKSVKLHKAQVLIQEGKKANETAYMVGYNSPAQFSREYKRHFGYSPSAT